jgi:nucleoside-diphosphate-sugar epimerase
MRVLVTGANGFIGTYLCKALAKKGVKINAVVKNSMDNLENIKFFVKELSSETNCQDILNGVDVVIHLAARAHVMKEVEKNPYQKYFLTNVEATSNLANQAAINGVKRFVFLSSIGVNGNISKRPFNEEDSTNPIEMYATSKKEAEDNLWKINKQTNLEVVVIRPPLVYGKGSKGNFKKLMDICNYKLPLPFGAVKNKRSLIYIENLIDFILICIEHPNAANETFLISDDDDVSTTQLIKCIRLENGRKKLLIPIPQSSLNFLSNLIGKSSLYEKLCGNLEVDITKAKKLLNWNPPYSFKEGIHKTVRSNKSND